jgi:two-component system nitrogen regulation sensor histidine kinase NtrY
MTKVGTLGSAFNRMTRRLEEQTGSAGFGEQPAGQPALLHRGRALRRHRRDPVGDRDRNIRLINSSAEALLKTAQAPRSANRLRKLAPELTRSSTRGARGHHPVRLGRGSRAPWRSRRVKVEGGHVITFDDITDQLLGPAPRGVVGRRTKDRAREQEPADADPARCERLQRRYGKEIASDRGRSNG